MLSGPRMFAVLLSGICVGLVGCAQNCEVAHVEEKDAATAEASAGPQAPDFAFKTVDGKSARLSDYRGKYVLVDFWATWCGPCKGETPHLKAAYDAYGKNGTFEIIGLSLDDDPKAPKNYAAKNKLTWVQGFLGNPSPVADQYGVTGIPHILLIGPDGRIVAEDLRGSRIKAAIGQALGES